MLIVKFSLSKNYGFLCLVQKCSKLKKVVLFQQCLLQVELTSCKASAVLFHRKKSHTVCRIIVKYLRNVSKQYFQ